MTISGPTRPPPGTHRWHSGGVDRFVTPRERRLWVLAGVVVVAIWASLSVTRGIAGTLRDRGLIDDMFFWSAMVLFAAIALVAFRARLRGLEIGALIGIVAVYALVFLRMTIPEERTHLVEYGLVGVLVFEALLERWGRIRRAAVWAVLVTAVLGSVDEMIQSLIPSRVFDWRDIGFNAGAGLMAVVAGSVVRSLQRRRASRAR